jgi:predicted acylesterase/phospholipase RssA
VWEAALATSAASSFFDPVTIAGQRFVDGATDANNPINELWTEADNFFRDSSIPDWRLEDNVHCVISIGTGKPSLKPFGKSALEIGKTILSNATNTEKVAERFERLHSSLFDKNKAFRFNVSEGLEDIGLEEADRLPAITAATKRYIAKQETLTRARACAEVLKERQSMMQFN